MEGNGPKFQVEPGQAAGLVKPPGGRVWLAVS